MLLCHICVIKFWMYPDGLEMSCLLKLLISSSNVCLVPSSTSLRPSLGPATWSSNLKLLMFLGALRSDLNLSFAASYYIPGWLPWVALLEHNVWALLISTPMWYRRRPPADSNLAPAHLMLWTPHKRHPSSSMYGYTVCVQGFLFPTVDPSTMIMGKNGVWKDWTT